MKVPMVTRSLLLAAALSFEAALPAMAQAVGTGAYDRADNQAINTARRATSLVERNYETSLVGEYVSRPTTVQGIAGTTIVSGSVVVNNGSVTEAGPGSNASMLQVKCPLFGGGVVVIRGVRTVNRGNIQSFGGEGASVVRVDCSGLGYTSVRATGNTFTGSGTVRTID